MGFYTSAIGQRKRTQAGPPRQQHNCCIEHTSRGPLTPDLPLGLLGVKGRSAHVVTACELLISHKSPPLSLQDAVPPTSATSFFASLGKLGNSLSSRPPCHWWDTIISLSSRPEAGTVGCYDGSYHILAGNLCLITGSGLYIFLIINTVAGVLIPSLTASNWCEFNYIYIYKKEFMQLTLWDRCFKWRINAVWGIWLFYVLIQQSTRVWKNKV